MHKYLFYPGCSLQRSARPYLDSVKAISEDIDLELAEIEDWNCCGATEYISVSRLSAYALNGRNLALAAQQANGANTVVAPCSACYLNLAKTDNYMAKDARLNELVNEALDAGGLHYAADQYQADILVTLCPMCQLNLDAYQEGMNKYFGTDYHVPVVYFTQLIGLAFGHDPLSLGLGKEFVDARPALAKIGIEVPAEEPAKKPRRRKDDPRLPMPRPLAQTQTKEEKA